MHTVLAYKNFAANRNLSHIGLGVAAINTAKVLTKARVPTTVWPIVGAQDLRDKLTKAPAKNVVISAPWIEARELYELSNQFSYTNFVVCCHSNVGFLQADRHGVKLLRDTVDVQAATGNVYVAGNSERFCQFVRHGLGAPCTFLPNLYYLHDAPLPPPKTFSSGTLRIGAFGAIRALKNPMSSAAAAIEISRKLHVPMELWVSGGRTEGGGDVALGAVKELLQGLPGVSLVESPWQTWPEFKRTVASMDLLLQPSYTESFNMVTADGVSEGVPSVVSTAIDWAPDSWKADSDDTMEIARIGRHLLKDPQAGCEGKAALETYVAAGISHYKNFFHRVDEWS